jgi:hypothetical protein
MTALLMVAYMAHLAQYATTLAAQVGMLALALAHIDLGDTAAWGLLAGVITPLLTSVVQRPTWSSRKRTVWGVVVSVVIGVLTCLADGTLDHATTVLATVAAVVVVSATTYKALWKPSGVTDSIEVATTPGPRHAAS